MKFRNFAFCAVVFFLSGCANTNYRVDQLDGSNGMALPLKFDSVSGVRNGETVKAEVRFAQGADTILINLTLHLSPAAECRSADYRAVIGGKSTAGSVTCESLAFQGGQDAPAIGGVFILKDTAGQPGYRVTMPSTQIQRRFTP